MMRVALAVGVLAFVAWCGAAYFDSGIALALLEHAAFCD
ncbi:MFS transporter [Burkholderia diffusa]|uniref:MFS transporter n=1 Tax=Burkholderia diffusa TaxID=488732 RepID=A0AAW3PCE4_9BURK|nr:MFS transporter [Burkholderia diffusa]KUZ07256.1 MFS transporter [Burkholderia diffusa]KVC14793.1 MFS transporter [Burkholderia diffusa]KVC39858.1 MFS transporter [Burkholderia diffusa]KVG25658.1 MFS transporter [Burkholderia diffusa]